MHGRKNIKLYSWCMVYPRLIFSQEPVYEHVLKLCKFCYGTFCSLRCSRMGQPENIFCLSHDARQSVDNNKFRL